MLKLRRDRIKKPGLRLFWPDFMADSVGTIDFAALVATGIKAILIDLDGTVVARGQYEVDPNVSKVLRAQKIPVYIATNRPKNRELKDLKDLLNADGVIHPAGIVGKPSKRYYRQALKTVGLQAAEVAMVGDRYLQDIYGANRAGLWTVAVNKLDKPVNKFDRLLSGGERRFGKRIAKRYYS